jgi:hypothetical protein
MFFNKEQEKISSPTQKTLVRRHLTRRATTTHRRHKEPLTRPSS